MSDRNPKFAEQLAAARPTTRRLVASILFDAWPGQAAVVDFGIDSQKHYEALYFPIREGEITPKALDAALGDGPKLTALVREAASNPHKDVEFHTSWDLILGRQSDNLLSAPDASDFWRCQGLTPPSETDGNSKSADGRRIPEEANSQRAEDVHRDALTMAGADRPPANADDGKISLRDLRNGTQEREKREEHQKAKSHDIER